MRVVAIIALFVLAVTAIVEGAVIARLSSRVDQLAEEVARRRPHGSAGSSDLSGPTGIATARVAPASAPLPRLVAPPVPSGESPPAVAVLEQALSTPTGRQHLQTAMETLREEARQERLARNVEEDVSREQRRRETMVRVLGLSSAEQNRVQQLHTQMQTGRQRVIEEMKAGLKNAETADDEIDALEDETDRQVNALLGEERQRKLREARRAERRRDREGSPTGGGGAGPPSTAPAHPGAAPPPPGAPAPNAGQ